MQADISQAQFCRERLDRSDRAPSPVETDKFTFGQMESHGGEVASYAAAQLQHTATLDRRRLHPAEKSNRGEPDGMGLRKNCSWIQNLVVNTDIVSGQAHTRSRRDNQIAMDK